MSSKRFPILAVGDLPERRSPPASHLWTFWVIRGCGSPRTHWLDQKGILLRQRFPFRLGRERQDKQSEQEDAAHRQTGVA